MKMGITRRALALIFMIVLLVSNCAYIAFAAALATTEAPVDFEESVELSASSAAAVVVDQFSLDVTASANISDNSVVDVVITAKDIKQELDGVEFTLNFDSSLVEGVVTEAGAEMDSFITASPMYSLKVGNVAGDAFRYEQICLYDAASASYKCMFVDMYEYPYEVSGQSYHGLTNDGDLVITIPFKVREGNAADQQYLFSVTDVLGTTTDGLICVSGCGDSVVYESHVHQWKNGTCSGCGATCAHNYSSTVVPPTCTDTGYTTHICAICGHIKVTDPVPVISHNFVNGFCSVCGAEDDAAVTIPVFKVSSASLSFESEIVYNIYYTVSDMSSVVEMGMVTFNERLSNGTHANAVDVISGYVTDGAECMVHTNGIPAKKMGDALYFRVYAKLTDGSYVYSDVAGYHAVAYANSILKNSQSNEMKSLVVAMLNYGAEAQKYFNYKTDSLMNAGLTAAQKALVSSYDESMIASLSAADSSKTTAFPKTASAFGANTSVSFDGAFSVNYYFTAKYAVDNGMKMYFWDADTYNSVSKLTRQNATRVIDMVLNGSEYWGQVQGIAAKEIDQPIYVAVVYTSGGVEYTSGVTVYSLGRYCEVTAAKDSSEMQDFAAATGVYGYYAKKYFASIA